MNKEILYCNLTVSYGNKNIILKEIVYKETDGFYHNKKMFNDPVKVIKVDVIKILGLENKPSGYKEIVKSEENRNKITGAYE